MVDKIDRGAQRTEKPAEYPAEYYRDNGRKKGRHGKADNNFSWCDKSKKSYERVCPYKPSAVKSIGEGKTDRDKKWCDKKREKKDLRTMLNRFDKKPPVKR